MFICRRDMRISWTRWETPPCLLFLFFRSFFRNVERHNHEAWTLGSIVSHKGLDSKSFAGIWGSFAIIWTLSFLCERKNEKPSGMEDGNLVSFSRACPIIQLPCRIKDEPFHPNIIFLKWWQRQTALWSIHYDWVITNTRCIEILFFPFFWCHWYHGTETKG